MGCLRYLRIRTIFKMANIVTSQATSLSVLVVVLHHLFEIFPCFHYQTVLITDAKVIYYIGTAIRTNGDLSIYQLFLFFIPQMKCIFLHPFRILLNPFYFKKAFIMGLINSDFQFKQLLWLNAFNILIIRNILNHTKTRH